jgi:hypothetical protein
MTHVRRAFALSALLLLLSGCAPDPTLTAEQVVGPIPDAASAHQRAALADDRVTREEYDAAFELFSACVRKAGFEVLVQGESNETIAYSVTETAVTSGVEGECYDTEFRMIDVVWQMSHVDTSEATTQLRECLEAHGIRPANTTEEVAQQLADAGIGLGSCE